MAVILLVGGHGFIGTHVRERLSGAGYETICVDWLEPRVHGDNRPEGVDFAGRAGTIPYALLTDADAIIHLGAQVGVADSMTDPLRYVRGNTEDTAEFLANLGRAHRNGHRWDKLVVASSMAIYGEASRTDITEGDPVVPTSVYGLTKYDQERLCLTLGKGLGLSPLALRFFNVYGPGQALTNPYTGVLANFANWIKQGIRPKVTEDGQQTRDFLYVTDVAEAVVGALASPAVGAVNIGTGQATTIEQAARGLATAMGSDLGPEITGVYRPGDVRHCTANVDRASAWLGWKAQVPFSEGIVQYAKALT